MTDTAPSASSETPNDRHYALWAVLRREPGTPVPEELPAIVDVAAAAGDTLRGVYDVSGLRADADILLWLVGRSAEHLQAVLRDLRRTREARGARSDMERARGAPRRGVQPRPQPRLRPGLAPKQWVTVYPFVRSYEWYLLPAEERGAMLGEHGRMGRDYPQVQSNTVASFALGDYEWLLALEADDVIDLVDLMRYLRATEARRHVREEVPFFTGRLIEPSEIADVVR